MSLPAPDHQKNRPPKAADFDPSQLSLLVFGPGHGEAQVLIFPDGSLGVIDGCREPNNGDPTGRGDPVREFINDWFKGQANPRLRFVALTHPHCDHYAGLGRLIEAYSPMILELWRAQISDHWGDAYVEYRDKIEPNQDKLPTADDLTGLERVFGAFSARRCKTKVLGAPKLMFSGTFCGHRLSIRCVAPSLNDIDRTQQELFDRIHNKTTKARGRFDPNHTSAALVIEWHRSRILLGGDLLCGNKHLEGWTAASPLIAEKKFQVVKIAHHASNAAQDFDLLRRLDPKLSIVTPFKHAGGKSPPRPQDIKDLLNISKVAITSPPKWPSDPQNPQPCEPIPQRHNAHSHNHILKIEPPPRMNSTVCVSLNPNGKITKFLLTGEARRYQMTSTQ